MQKLTADEAQERLTQLKGWTIDDGKLKKDFGFKGFTTAIEFMNRLVPVAEKLNHHPDWANSYNRVTVNLMSHDARGLTKTDFIFAQKADEVAAELQR
ncbi:MAG: dcoH1 [Candidatus Saccharibacteria bacterium]|nr:dcoH1 [Candidatus Saccharibacteria bacterium]